MSSLIVKVVKVHAIEKHFNADKLSIVTVDNENGWHCVVGLDAYEAGDLVVYIPPDAIIAQETVDKYNLSAYLKKGNRTKTIKLRGAISEGIIIDMPKGHKRGDDVAKELGITKYEVPERAVQGQSGVITKKRINPTFVKYTKIENVKNYGQVFEEGDIVIVTEKIHGSNARYGLLPIVIDKRQPFMYRMRLLWDKHIKGKTHEFVYGSHNVQLHGDKSKNFYGTDLWGKIGEKYGIDNNKMFPDLIVFGEIYGKGVQDLTYGMDELEFVVFDIMIEGEYQSWSAVKEYCKWAEIPTVPELYAGPWYNGLLEDFTDGQSVICPSQMREGCVVKSLTEERHPHIGRKILKSVSTKYLTRKGGTEYK